MRREFEWPLTAALAAALAVWLAGPANADGLSPANSAAGLSRQARCASLGQGFAALKGTDDCLRISGYVAAGDNLEPDRRIVGIRAPFGRLAPSGIVTGVGGSAQTIVRAPADLGRAFTHVSHDDFAR